MFICDGCDVLSCSVVALRRDYYVEDEFECWFGRVEK